MAYRIPNKHPLDINQRVGVGVSIPFNGPAVFNTTYTTSEQIKSNIINYILTNNNERIFNPDFGANLRAQLFENVTPIEELSQKYDISLFAFCSHNKKRPNNVILGN